MLSSAYVSWHIALASASLNSPRPSVITSRSCEELKYLRYYLFNISYPKRSLGASHSENFFDLAESDFWVIRNMAQYQNQQRTTLIETKTYRKWRHITKEEFLKGIIVGTQAKNMYREDEVLLKYEQAFALLPVTHFYSYAELNFRTHLVHPLVVSS